MDHDTREIAQHLNAEITGRLEQAHDLAIRGQSPRGRSIDHAEVATALLTVLDDLTILAKTVTILAETPPKRPRRFGTSAKTSLMGLDFRRQRSGSTARDE